MQIKPIIKTVFYSLCFLGVFLATTNLTIALATKDEFVSKPITGVTYNNVHATVNKVTVNKVKEKTDIVSCVDLPNNSDWLPYTTITIGEETISAEQMILINYKKPETSASSHRCYHFIFPKAVTSKTVKFTINKLQTTIPESLTQEMCNDAQNKIQVTYPDFSFSCNIGDHGIGLKLNETPQGMNDAEAHFLINDALTNTVSGPWEMNVSIP